MSGMVLDLETMTISAFLHNKPDTICASIQS